MEDPRYGEDVFLRHCTRSGFAGENGFACLELGPGESLFSALLARAHGADKCWLIDVGDFRSARFPPTGRWRIISTQKACQCRWRTPFNRLRFSELLDRFRRAGFAIETVETERWTALPTARRSLSPRFRDPPDDELLVRGFDVVLRAQ